MDIYDLYVLKIQECSSITNAATALGVSQPAVSAGLNSLENALGYFLFDRKSKPIKLTSEGEAYIEYIYAKEEAKNNLENKIKDIQLKESTDIRIGAPPAYVSALLLPGVCGYMSAHSTGDINIAEGTIAYLTELLSKNTIDAFISTSPSYLPADFQAELFCEERICVCLQQQDPLNKFIQAALKLKNDEFPIELLKEKEFVFQDESQPLQLLTDSYLKDKLFDPICRVRVDQATSAIQLVAHGCGVCFAPEIIAKYLQNEVNIAAYVVPDGQLRRNLYIVRSRMRYMSAGQKDFINYIKDSLRMRCSSPKNN